MKCPKCGTDFVPTVKNRYTTKYCSRKCANSRDWAGTDFEELRKRQSKKARLVASSEPPEVRKLRIDAACQTKAKKKEDRLQNDAFDTLSPKLKKERIRREQDGSCDICKNESSWQGKELNLQLDHVSGDRKDNSRGNLRLLCPNCHSQTETFCNMNKVTNRDILEAAKTNRNIYSLCLSLGLQPSGKSYERVKKLLPC